jgi:IS30 family transposase
MRGYTQLAQEQRYQIQALRKAGVNQSEITANVGIHTSTISRELRRNHGLGGYRPKQAHRYTMARRQNKNRPPIGDDVWTLVEHPLREEWRPEQISLWLEAQTGISISHEWIYQYVLQGKSTGGEFYRHRRCQKQRRRQLQPPGSAD